MIHERGGTAIQALEPAVEGLAPVVEGWGPNDGIIFATCLSMNHGANPTQNLHYVSNAWTDFQLSSFDAGNGFLGEHLHVV
jgi:hypothetical protein